MSTPEEQPDHEEVFTRARAARAEMAAALDEGRDPAPDEPVRWQPVWKRPRTPTSKAAKAVELRRQRLRLRDAADIAGGVDLVDAAQFQQPPGGHKQPQNFLWADAAELVDADELPDLRTVDGANGYMGAEPAIGDPVRKGTGAARDALRLTAIARAGRFPQQHRGCLTYSLVVDVARSVG